MVCHNFGIRRLVSIFVLSIAILGFAKELNASDFFTADSPSFSAFTGNAGYVAQREPVQLRLISEDKGIQPGRPFWLALQIDLDKGWHTYWKNPGDSGLGTSVEWTFPTGFEVTELEWATPERFDDKSIISFGYAHPFVILAKITPDKTLVPGEDVQLEATVRWVACNDGNCIPGDCTNKVTLPVTKATPLKDGQQTPLFTKARDRLPQSNWKVAATNGPDVLKVSLQPPLAAKGAIETAYFLPADADIINYHSPIALQPTDQGGYSLDLAKLSSSDTPPATLDGVLLLKRTGNPSPLAVNVHVPMEGGLVSFADTGIARMSQMSEDAFQEFEGGLGVALLMAFVGGMILNLMPCVLPVISLKVLSIVKMAGYNRLATFKHGLVFTAGVLVSFWLLAGVLLALQAYGHVVGWGFQLQEPIFVAVLAAVLLIFALSLFGVFEMGTVVASWAGQKESHNTKKSNGLVGSFFNGVLATAVATPCTGPFLGAAIAFAVTLPPAAALLVFTSLGLGMAFPYLMLTLFPNLTRWLPKPGNWMITFKQLMAFLLFATILWLVWVFGAQTNNEGVLLLLCSLFLLSLTCWIYGKWCHPLRSQRVQRAATLASIFMALMASYVLVISAQMLPPVDDKTVAIDVASSEANPRAWLPFSPNLVDELRAAGKPVFIDFTAKWCVICQTNHMVLLLEDIENKFEQLGIVKIKADWTRNDPAITKELRRYGRNGVPLYLLYVPGMDAPVILPQVLTPDAVLGVLDKLQNNVAKTNNSSKVVTNP